MIIFGITQAINSNTAFLKFVDTGGKNNNNKKWNGTLSSLIKVFSYLSIYCFILKCFLPCATALAERGEIQLLITVIITTSQSGKDGDLRCISQEQKFHIDIPQRQATPESNVPTNHQELLVNPL